jgi:hypothetical protein
MNLVTLIRGRVENFRFSRVQIRSTSFSLSIPQFRKPVFSLEIFRLWHCTTYFRSCICFPETCVNPLAARTPIMIPTAGKVSGRCTGTCLRKKRSCRPVPILERSPFCRRWKWGVEVCAWNGQYSRYKVFFYYPFYSIPGL